MEAVTCLPSAGSMPLAEAGVLFPQKDLRPLILKYRADGLTAQGAYHALEVEPWEYDLLLSRTKERFAKNMKEEKDHEKADRT